MKCAISGLDINDGDLVITPTRHNKPGEGVPILVAVLKVLFSEMKPGPYIDGLDKRIENLESRLTAAGG